MVVSVIVLILLSAYFVYVIAWVPNYRYVAIIGLLLLFLFKLSAWRILPSERAYVRERAKSIVEERLAFVSPAAVL
ncbi:hypothetical protein LSM04_004843 [Trypanosoma melophagium]|uniref:uncharacterized protein n=1 Tax=Trypanosoma melophagium TaxID=715481 RepID=UPI003519ED59|nr:hypothetical protein LSM04_004843 [Trypanosoma melophagium]